ncbi:MAG: PA14 domain-containing protein, partial [Planctomycetota bacterium]
MYGKMVSAFVVVCVVGFSVCSVVPAAAVEEMSAEEQIRAGKGLIGTYYNSDDFDEQEVGMIDLLPTIDYEWGDSRGSDWSARWSGFVKAPVTGEVTFIAEVQDGIRLTIGNTAVIDSLEQGGIQTGKVNMTGGQKAPIKLEFVSSTKKALLRLYWQWAGKEKEIIPAAALSHSTEGLPKEFMVFDFDNRPSEQNSGDDDDEEAAGPRYQQG